MRPISIFADAAMTVPAPSSAREKNDRLINRAWGVAVLSGTLTIAVGLFALAGKSLLPGFNGGAVIDGAVLCALGFGVYKRNRVAAILLPTVVLIGTIYALSQGTKTSPLQIIFAYFYFRGMLAVLAYHQQASKPNVLEVGEVGQQSLVVA
jgi:hypothetical protein